MITHNLSLIAADPDHRHPRNHWRLALTSTILLALLAAPGQATAFGSPITEFPVPTPNSQPAGITRGSDGNLWFTEAVGDKIGRITPSGVITEFPLGEGAAPVGITAGPRDALTPWLAGTSPPRRGQAAPSWFTLESDAIGAITTTGQIRTFPTPTTGQVPHGIVAGPDGALWFTYLFGEVIGRMTASGTFTEYAIPTDNPQSHSLTVGPDGAIWFTQFLGNKIARITTEGDIEEFPLPHPGSRPHGIVAGPDGALWFAETRGNRIGRITTDGDIDEFALPYPNSGPHEIAVGEDGNLWFTEIAGNRIGTIDPLTKAIAEYPIATPDSGPGYIVAGPDRAMWFHERKANQIGRISIGAGDPDMPDTTH
jgi:streptogramin lyase